MSLLDFFFPSADLARNRPYVDLGLSVYWATMNVGARFEYEYGDSFLWGETEPVKRGDYKFRSKNGYGFTRYVTEPCENTDYQSTLLMEDDAARQRWGGQWRMPTVDEMKELVRRCYWQALLINHTIRAYRITGPNGNSILLPQVDLWTSSLYRNNSFAYSLHFEESTYDDDDDEDEDEDDEEEDEEREEEEEQKVPKIMEEYREHRLSVRAVLPKS